jgi:hypothetical protein
MAKNRCKTWLLADASLFRQAKVDWVSSSGNVNYVKGQTDRIYFIKNLKLIKTNKTNKNL